MPLDFAGALLGALVQWVGGAAGNRLRRLGSGSPAQSAIRRVVNASIEPALVDLGTPPASAGPVLEALRLHLAHRLDIDLVAMNDPGAVLATWLAPLDDPGQHLAGTGYLSSHNILISDLSDRLRQHILLGIQADALDNGPLAPLWHALAAAHHERRAIAHDEKLYATLTEIQAQTRAILTSLNPGPRHARPGKRTLGQPIDRVRPLDLGVHPSIAVGTAANPPGELPAYVPRAHDDTLQALVTDAQASGEVRMAVLVGGSSTGKTRALWEAVRRLPPPWRIWHPLRPDQPSAVLTDLDAVGTHTVIWLNELQRYLFTPGGKAGEQVAAALGELLARPKRGPLLIVGTLWPDYWDILTRIPKPGSPDPHPQAGDLLRNIGIRVPDVFTGTDLEAAMTLADEQGDLRLAEALRKAPDGALTQYLAGGPALIERYDKANTLAQALLHAAMDARRLGHGAGLSRRMLEAAAAGYLSDQQWDLVAADGLEQAFSYLTDPLPCRGARPPLTRIRPRPGFDRRVAPARDAEDEQGYRLADYLEEFGANARRLICPPASLWNAVTEHSEPSDCAALAKAASDRGRYRHAFHLSQRGGNPATLWQLASIRELLGDEEGAERLYRSAADVADPDALWKLAELRELAGDGAEAERLVRRVADTSHVLWRIAEQRIAAKDADAVKHLHAAVNASTVLGDLAVLREETGDHEGAERLAHEAAAQGDTSTLRDLAEMREEAGDLSGAERLYRAAADAGDARALSSLAVLRQEAGDRIGADRLYRAAAAAGDVQALSNLAVLRAEAGDAKGAAKLMRAAADAGSTDALIDLAILQERAGDHENAERLYRDAVGARGIGAVVNLALLLERNGHGKAFERLSELTMHNGRPGGLLAIALLREEAGDHARAERLCRAAVDSGDTIALWHLAEIRERAGDREEAERLARSAADAGHIGALLNVAIRREQAGDARWPGLLRFGVEADGRVADPW
ncbi:hypothetical protein GCM10009555_072470 [Acrocarpospora macrocephala]|uniref:Uncharacterized protein n=1 Tax=Acrocarpospora macrocephala TaxID=150177 RepID=A0A5M3WHI9_9ACTN|nr:sel1 repeat family protein [Acrocarpospora macrocephala]GES08607.1 hypothetical protein Amac_022030 [Acrocarpospora macrocephala]